MYLNRFYVLQNKTNLTEPTYPHTNVPLFTRMCPFLWDSNGNWQDINKHTDIDTKRKKERKKETLQDNYEKK